MSEVPEIHIQRWEAIDFPQTEDEERVGKVDPYALMNHHNIHDPYVRDSEGRTIVESVIRIQSH